MSYINADTVPGHPLSGSGVSIPAGTNEGYTPNSGSDGWNYSNLPTTDPEVKGALWQDADTQYVLKVSQG